jgi:hydroxypyruvate isomerase
MDRFLAGSIPDDVLTACHSAACALLFPDFIMITRRSALTKIAGGAALAASATLAQRLDAAEAAAGAGLKGRVHHSVCKWCYDKIPLDTLCQAGQEIGLQSVELLTVEDFPTLKKYGLTCAMVTGIPGGIPKGLNRLENHDTLVAWFEATLPQVAAAGYPNMICFSGNRKGMSDEQGLANCVTGLKRIVGLAEKHQVTICLELLNSKVNHKDYMGDHTAWGFELCRQVGSERFKILYDIYHMQIMEGDVIRTIQDNHRYIGHYHTGGVPGRHEIDETQELYYPAIMQAIVATGFKGYVAQEFIPQRPDALASLKQGVHICDV